MKQKIFIAVFIALTASLFIFDTPSLFSQENNIESRLKEGDARLFNMEMGEAQQIYESILKEDPLNYEALWKLSRCYIWHGMVAKKEKDKKKEWGKAKDYAKQAVEVNPNGAEGHLYIAIASGKTAHLSSGGERVKASWEIKEAAEKAMECNPNEPKAYLTLGVWHRGVATSSSIEKQLAKMFFGELPKGTLEESLQLLLKSISLGGKNVKNYYELALTYEAMKDYENARKEYNNALSAPSAYPEDAETKEKIKKILKKKKYSD